MGMPRDRRNRIAPPLLTALLLCALLLAGCTIRTVPLGTAASATEPPAAGDTSPQTEAAPVAPETETFTVSYVVAGATVQTAVLPAGERPEPYVPEIGGTEFLGWQDEAGNYVTPEELPVTADVTYTARLAPSLLRDVYYLEAEGGVFRPDDPLTRQEAGVMLYTLLAAKPAIPDPLPEEPQGEPMGLNANHDHEGDEVEAAGAVVAHSGEGEDAEHPVKREDPRYALLAAVCAAGYMDAAEDGSLRPRQAMDAESFSALLSPFFREDTLAEALTLLDGETVSRLDAARVMNALLERAAPAENPGGWADIPDDFAELDTLRAASESGTAEPGLLLLSNGQLYYIGEDGRCLRDEDVGTLHFGSDGRFTSGSEELDALVEAAVAANVNADDPHETQLRSVYNYIRDNFVYLRRNSVAYASHGWEIDEATVMLDTHYGNCYSFAAALWALARGIGYDAHAVSGQVGELRTPHGWVHITLEDGVRYFFDVELEYAALRDGATNYPMFKLPWSSATVNWEYLFNWYIEGCA